MKLRLECYEHERDAAVSAVRSVFPVSSVSKGYPNTRQTGSSGTPCEMRYYIEVDGSAPTGGADLSYDLAADMLRFLGILRDRLGFDPGPELAAVKSFYEKSGGMSVADKSRLAAEWRAAVLDRCLKGGAPACQKA